MYNNSERIFDAVLRKIIRSRRTGFESPLPLIKPAKTAVGFGKHRFPRHFFLADTHGLVAAVHERAACRGIKHIRRRTGDGYQLSVVILRVIDGIEQSLRIRMIGRIKDIADVSRLNDLSAIHDGDPVTKAGDDA